MFCTVLTLLALSSPLCIKDDGPPEFCHDLDCPKYTVKDLSLGPDVELRSYEAGVWVSTNVQGVHYDKAVGTGFMRLFAYISGANEDMKKIPMTAPVRVELTPGQGPFCEDHFKVSFFVPFDMQESGPPAPVDSTLFVDPAAATDYYVLSYPGRTNEKEIIEKATSLVQALDEQKLPYDFSSFFAAGYDSPFRIFNRHNEVWVAAGAQPAAVAAEAAK
ncbi:hypothetical protein CHLRE_06g299700v5 [Chlamydomonas reinhardtii]|uniref:SOUL heme-binding protein n=1 Tax=Chlamydomonas reinhardtii TaxID=3055 RepID=A0A2K3DQW1_CHLRE|nr:uncharacterized protein CHLRE_06g299700v5 [Chlamydomonas reinhardtii]PNW82920.1 hypothetical protein CHLRE_06g299700v5 [Chlamydomonas reinhardtii]